MNSSGRARPSGRRARYIGALSVIAACAAFLAIPSGASAVSVNCGGKLFLNRTADAGPNGVRYVLQCNEDILGYSLTSSKKTDYFTPDPTVFLPSGEPSDDHFSCEGMIPGDGVGCTGTMAKGSHVNGWIATQGPRCNPAVKGWVTVITTQLDSHDEPFIATSHPFPLKGPDGCPTASASAAAASSNGPSLGLGSIGESSFWQPVTV